MAKARERSTRRASPRKVRSALGYGEPSRLASRMTVAAELGCSLRGGLIRLPPCSQVLAHASEEEVRHRRPVGTLPHDEVEGLEPPSLSDSIVERALHGLLGDRGDLDDLVEDVRVAGQRRIPVRSPATCFA